MKLLSPQEAADRCECSLSHFHRKIKPRIPHVPIGGLKRYDEKDVDAYRRGVSIPTPGDPSMSITAAHAPGIYFLHAPAAHLVKVGFASDMYVRVNAIRLMSPVPLALIGSWLGGGKVEEGKVLEYLSHHRRHGEWFADEVEVLEVAQRPQQTPIGWVAKQCARKLRAAEADLMASAKRIVAAGSRR